MRSLLTAALVVMSVAPGEAQGAFAPGQVWTYQTRVGEEQSTLTIVRVETLPKLGMVVHVSLNGLRVKNPQAPGGRSATIGHLPFSAEAVQKSVVRKVRDGAPLPSFEEGYREWRRAVDGGRGGVFTTSVAEAVTYVEKTLNQ